MTGTVGPGVRAFFALALPDEMRAHLAGVCQSLRSEIGEESRPRFTLPDQYHLTSKFVGTVTEASVATLRKVLRACAPDTAPECTLQGLGTFGSAVHARVLHVDVSDPSGAISALAQSLESMVHARLGIAPEAREYHPHITLARFGRGADVRDLLQRSSLEPLTLSAKSLGLYGSVQTAQGSRYTVLDEVGYGPSGSGSGI